MFPNTIIGTTKKHFWRCCRRGLIGVFTGINAYKNMKGMHQCFNVLYLSRPCCRLETERWSLATTVVSKLSWNLFSCTGLAREEPKLIYSCNRIFALSLGETFTSIDRLAGECKGPDGKGVYVVAGKASPDRGAVTVLTELGTGAGVWLQACRLVLMGVGSFYVSTDQIALTSCIDHYL